MKTITLDQFKGCLMGLAFGDALAARYEGGYLERALWFLFGRKNGRMRFTDDTQMTLDIIDSLLVCEKIDQNHLAMCFANSYRWSRGYGPAAAKLLKRIKNGAAWQEVNRLKFSDGSYGNGAAMRAPVLALFYHDNSEQLFKTVRLVSEITHAHPLAIEGAQLVSLCVWHALHHKQASFIIEELLKVSKEKVFQQNLLRLKELTINNHLVTTKESKKLFGNDITAENSCITAIMTAFQFIDKPYLTMIDFICKCGGDTDTIAAMAGAIWGAYNGFKIIEGVSVSQIEFGEKIESLADQILEFNCNGTSHES
ncbi:MAG: ADP-ribosylglycohydrolase family protein [Alcanivoracaceae bacterium]|nr:ADP-ribosylglycohydrolase family protein [Alcanivoracaceae bacterium]